jgi:hypothetical protein
MMALFSLSGKAQTITNPKHGVMYYVYCNSGIVKSPDKKFVGYFSANAMKDTNDVARYDIRDTLIYKSGELVGKFKAPRVYDADGRYMGSIFEDFEYATDDKKAIVAYFDMTVNVKWAVVLIYFYNK